MVARLIVSLLSITVVCSAPPALELGELTEHINPQANLASQGMPAVYATVLPKTYPLRFTVQAGASYRTSRFLHYGRKLRLWW